MVLLLVVAWVVVAALALLTAIGPRRWWSYITRQVRPHVTEPTGDGYGMRTMRNVAVTIVAFVLAFVVTYDWARVSPEELTEAARDVVDRVPDDDLDQARFRVEMEDHLHRDVFVESVDLEDDETGWVVTLTDPEETDVPKESDGLYDGPAVTCFTVTERDGTRSFGAINAGPCSGAE
ncbi:hypothetical protein [Nocardioides plantarum]|uniref:Uncharacterized protein n=1 Tax=Nocardioides plantarum TaxID=29299 RepID=A0ABV5KG83_9ACTN|nr:hypothetical protein [Nocardioides plantarum]